MPLNLVRLPRTVIEMILTRRQVWLGMGALGAANILSQPAMGQESFGAEFLADGKMARIISGDSFVLNDGRRVRLAAMDAPRRAINEAVAQPLARQATEHLRELISEQPLSFVDAASDRFGRLRAHVMVGTNKKWLQGQMLAAGMGRVRIWSDGDRITKMLDIEDQARRNKTGIWAKLFYAIRDPQNVNSARGSFQIVEGEVIDAVSTRKMTYLNFGLDWRKDFTAQATKKTTRAFAKAGINLLGLSGAKIRVRGLIKSSNGPMIWLNYPSQLQLLDNE